MDKIDIRLNVNDEEVHVSANGSRSLLNLLHDYPDLQFRGTKFGCGIGECRACTVLVDDPQAGHRRAQQSCMTPLRHCQGQSVYTIESVAGTAYADVQKEFVDQFAFQCGYCAPGFIMSTIGLLEQLKVKPVAIDQLPQLIHDALGENYCRCTGYAKYYASVKRLAANVIGVNPDDVPDTSPLTPPPPYFETIAKPAGRTFASAHLELIRLLRSAAEIEHSLMIQYLYAVFSVKLPRYAMLAGWSTHRHGGPPNSLLGVAIEEMVHLHTVNQLLVALGARPNLGRQQFPLETDIYPFPVHLEPLSPGSVAKYVYIEAPHGKILSDDSDDISKAVNHWLNRYTRLNPVGSIYDRIVAMLDELDTSGHFPGLDYAHWRNELGKIKNEGEGGHFELFSSILLGTHPAFAGVANPWELPPQHADYPAYPLPLNPSAFDSADGAIQSPTFRKVAWLSNLYYWLVCMALDWSHLHDNRLLQAARRIMWGPIRSLGQFLACNGVGIPFDTLPMTYSPGLTDPDRLHLMEEMCEEIASCEQDVLRHLPEDYPLDTIRTFMQEIKSNSSVRELDGAKNKSEHSTLR
ncbi:ferritin-like domain-containing protein [Duganella radicis]|uniref:2Fe-2S iron-sulfur cluster binding domain-containing protein n=1 Tax=Duganella radicis TaxID=551988 RepID=A0A6L6PLK4_9BURK|nr:ferritin-like domain-containing protein [Duganella radicis]MTV39579.1 2Fe-2S iron-sulfur cluster binding domain-containing protein [Duganella radicis]